MKNIYYSLALLVSAAQLPTIVVAAPMDAFLSANQSTIPGQLQIEAAYDMVNSSIDVFHLRDNNATYKGTTVGDYHGGHLRIGMAVTPRIWLDGAFWQRNIQYSGDVAKINTWQLAGQYKIFEGSGYQPSIALRAGAWGNYADQLNKSSSTTVNGTTLNSVSVADPKDVQYQLDLIATSKILENTELTVFGGIGVSRTTLSSVSGTATQNGCNYNVAFGQSDTVGTLAQLCNASVVIDRFSIPNSSSGVNVYRETEYNAKFYHGGAMLNWHESNWQLRAGYQYQYISRNQIDDIIKSRGGVSYQSNHIFIGEVMYRVLTNTAVFLRGQYMTNQFTGEIPFAYNTMTASRFNNRYGIVSTGLVMTF